MKAQLTTPAAGSPARSPARVQRQTSASPAPDTPRGLPARAGRSEYAAIHAAAARGIATPWSAPPHAGAIPGMRPRTQVLASRAIAQPKLSIDGPRGAAVAAAIAPTGGGSPLPDPTRAQMESLFGLHLDGVRVVESGQPEQLGARAFAIGNEIHAARGEDLAASRNAELLGHELAHVAQQRQGRARPSAAQDHGGTLVVDAALEAEADAVGARIGRGEPAGIGGAAAACPAPVVQGDRIKIENWTEPFTDVDQLIETFKERRLGPADGWNADHRALLFQWMREDKTFPSAKVLIRALENTPAQQSIAGPQDVDWLVARYAGVFEIRTNAQQVRHFVGDRWAITQVPQERGDMFDVASALALDRRLCVVVIPSGRADDCDKILDFYRSFPKDRVCLVANDQFDRRELSDNWFLSVSRSTEYMHQSYERSKKRPGGTQAFRDTLADTMTGPRIDNEEKRAFGQALHEHGFEQGRHYALVMYRESGHHPGRGRDPSHPELDTGTQGFKDLLALIHSELRGERIPVPMGTVPDDSYKRMQPNLIEYWNWPCFSRYPEGTNRRQKENALLGYLAERYDVVAIGMRSGGMDALAYVGIPIISIDAATEFMKEQQGITKSSAASWRRPVKKQAMLADRYHNVYLKELRHDPNVGTLYRDRPEGGVEFEGAFRGENLDRLEKAISRYFGSTDAMGATAGGDLDLDPTSPLTSRNIGLLIKHRMLENEEDSNFFKNYAQKPELLKPLLENPQLLEALRKNPPLRDDPALLEQLLERPALLKNQALLEALRKDQALRDKLRKNPELLNDPAQLEELLKAASFNRQSGSAASARPQWRRAP